MTGVPQGESPSSSLNLGLCVQGTSTITWERPCQSLHYHCYPGVPQTHLEPTENHGPLCVLGLLRDS